MDEDLPSFGIDLASISQALIGHEPQATDPESHDVFLDWYSKNNSIIDNGAWGLVHHDAATLNFFQSQRRIQDAAFTPMGRQKLGLAAASQLNLKWANGTSVRSIGLTTTGYKGTREYEGLEFDVSDRTAIFSVKDAFASGLIMIAKVHMPKGQLWLARCRRPAKDPIEALRLASNALTTELTPSQIYTRIRFPQISFSAHTSLDWLRGMTLGNSGRLVQAHQDFEFFVGSNSPRLASAGGSALVFPEGFLVFYIPKGCPEPSFAFWADVDSWMPVTKQ